MRKEWKKPVLEVLDVNMTMATTKGSNFDSNFQQNHQIPIDPNTHLPLISS